VKINTYPLAGTVELEALYKSSTAALEEPRVGVRACSASFTKISREEEEEEEEDIFVYV
jgi:hypothetical protein